MGEARVFWITVLLNLRHFRCGKLGQEVFYEVMFMVDVFYFKRSKTRGWILYLLEICYQLQLLFLVFPKDLVGDQLGVTFELQSRDSYLYGEDQTNNKSLVLRLAINSKFRACLIIMSPSPSRTITTMHPFMMEVPSTNSSHSGGISSFTGELKSTMNSIRACDLMLPLEHIGFCILRFMLPNIPSFLPYRAS